MLVALGGVVSGAKLKPALNVFLQSDQSEPRKKKKVSQYSLRLASYSVTAATTQINYLSTRH